MEARALGKGLSALIPEKAKEDPAIERELDADVRYIETSLISDNRLQPRINYDKDQLAELAASIKEKGILQPILVRKMGEAYEVVAGERRLRAARSLSLDKVPVVVRTVSDQEALVLALIENIQREELNPIEEAEAFKKLIEEFEYSQEQVAQSVGKDRSTISNLLRLLRLPKEIQQGIAKGKISSGHARALLTLDDADQQRDVYDYAVQKQISVREIEQLVKTGLKGKKSGGKRTAIKDENVLALEEALQKVFGTKVVVNAKKNRGKIVIDYYSLDDLKRILNILKK